MKWFGVILCLVVAAVADKQVFNQKKCAKREQELTACITAGFEQQKLECRVETLVPGKYKKKACAKKERNFVAYCINKGYQTINLNCDPEIDEVEVERLHERRCVTDEGVYRGNKADTVLGLTCQAWSSQTPHSHSYLPENFPNEGLEENYCRNPDPTFKGQWCYTTDNATRWDYCDIPACSECADTGVYRGNKAVTESGLKCQAWDKQTPHTHTRIAANYPYGGLEANYCRNPDGASGGNWCYTEDPKVRWEYCGIPDCLLIEDVASECAKNGIYAGSSYRGTKNTTISGRTCQRWDTQGAPHNHTRTNINYVFAGLEENFCRNPDGAAGGNWCYTTEPAKRWEYCGIPNCEGEGAGECAVGIGSVGRDYRGTQAVTESGLTCQAWSSQSPHGHSRTAERYPSAGLEENYCRNPDGESLGNWCYTTDPSRRWEYCAVRECPDEEEEEEVVGECADNGVYRGTQAVTETGKTCMAWDKQDPHVHTRTVANYPDAGLEANYCRNPDGEPEGNWCYTVERETRWEYCGIPNC